MVKYRDITSRTRIMLEPYVEAILVRLTTEQIQTLRRSQRAQLQTGQRLITSHRAYERKQAMKSMCCDVAR